MKMSKLMDKIGSENAHTHHNEQGIFYAALQFDRLVAYGASFFLMHYSLVFPSTMKIQRRHFAGIK